MSDANQQHRNNAMRRGTISAGLMMVVSWVSVWNEKGFSVEMYVFCADVLWGISVGILCGNLLWELCGFSFFDFFCILL